MNSQVKKSYSLAFTVIILFSTVFAVLNPLAFGVQQLVVTVQTEKPWYLPGERVQILGAVKNTTNHPISSATVAIEVKDPRGNTIFLDIVYSGAEGSYRDNFRLSSNARIGQYTVYVTASKTGYVTATNQTHFNVTTEQLGRTIVSIAGHSFSIQNNYVKAQLNVTLFSESLNWIVASNRLILINPDGGKVYDNFLGIGGQADYKLLTVYNDTETTINYEFTLISPEKGYYMNMFGIYDAARTYLYASTSWMPAFLYTPAPIHSENLGTLAPESSKFIPLSLSMKRFEVALFMLTLQQPINTLSLSFGTTTPNKFLVAINQSDNIVQQELLNAYSLTVFNLPSGEYDIKITALSNAASLSSFSLQSGSTITIPSVSITEVEATGKSATPQGTMNYHIYVEWSIITSDILNVSAYVSGSLADSEEIDVIPLNYNQRDFYLTVNAPSSFGTYDINIEAKLKQAGASTQFLTTLKVQSIDYNITVLNYVKYYRQPSAWEWFWGARNPIIISPSELQVLSIGEIKVVDVGTDQNDSPVNATIEFVAKNKAGSLLSFGDGPHYNLWIQDLSGRDFLIAVMFADSEPKTILATLPVDGLRRLSFTLKFKISLEAEAILMVSSLFETIISAWTSGLSQIILSYVSDMVKLTALYTYEIWVEIDRGYLVFSDIRDFIEEFDIRSKEAAIDLAEEAFLKNGHNPVFAILSALWDWYSDGKIDAWTMATAIIRFLLWVINREQATIAKTIERAFNKACQKYLVEIPAKGVKTVDKFVQNIQVLFSIFRLAKIIYDLLTSPSEEGKMVGSAIGKAPAIDPFDPVVSISYSGQTSKTTFDYFGDVHSITANITSTNPAGATGEVNYIVDQNMTSTYVSILSQSTLQRDLLKSFGLNATSTELDWQEGSDSFWLRGNGLMYSGLHRTNLLLNSTWIQGYAEMSGDAIQVGNTAWFNTTIVYPFGKNLTYSISVVLPSDFTILRILSDGTYTIQDNTITWNNPISWLAIEFVSPHDIAISNLTTSKTIISQNQTLNLGATVSNQGNVTETFNMLAYANTTLIQNQTVTLEKGSSFPIAFTWDTTGFARGKYIMTLYVTTLQDEIDTADNTIADRTIAVTILGDINGDRTVNSLDLSQFGNAFGSMGTSTNWDSNADMNDDNIISVNDLWILGKNYGKTDP